MYWPRREVVRKDFVHDCQQNEHHHLELEYQSNPFMLSFYQDDVQRAVHETVIYVAEAIFKQEALLLQAVRNKFTKFVLELSSGADLDLGEAEAHELVTARWILSNLNSTLQYHLSYCCKMKHSCKTLG